MSPFVVIVRRWWVAALAVVGLGVAGALIALAVVTEPSGEPTGAPSPSPELVSLESSSATPDAAPSSGPTGTPAPGSLDVVPAGEARTAAPVPFDAPGDFGAGVSVRVTALEPVRGVARGPGEVAGPAVRMTLALTNDGPDAISLEGVVVAVSFGPDDTPASELTGPGGRAFGGELAPGATSTGRYVFAVPEDQRGRARAVVSYTGSAPSVAFAGALR